MKKESVPKEGNRLKHRYVQKFSGNGSQKVEAQMWGGWVDGGRFGNHLHSTDFLIRVLLYVVYHESPTDTTVTEPVPVTTDCSTDPQT